ncbi:MAG: hypothetical protein KBD90_03935, partial [Alphaproteobacteria bacterium]|nr:hypothetical protein [Alphaproteobacteria bacterium]
MHQLPYNSPPSRFFTNNPFQRSKKTWAVLLAALESEFAETTLNTLGAVVFQHDTRRRFHPFTYMEVGLRTKQKRNTVAWDLLKLHRMGLIKKGKHKEKYSQKNGWTGKTAICERIRTIQLPSDDLIERKKQLDQEAIAEIRKLKKERITEKKRIAAEKKSREQAEDRKSTPRWKPPASYGSDRGSEVQITPNFGLLEALFEENKIRSYKLDGDMRCRRYISRTLKSLKMADLRLAVTLFAQNRFLMDANAHGWLVARANALRAEGKEPFVNGRQINRYKNWCPSMVWFVANIHKLLNGYYNRTTPEERARRREEAQKVCEAPKHSSPSSALSSEALATMEKQRLEKEAQDKMELQAKLDREAAHRAKPYWNDLKLEDRYKLEQQFMEALKRGETAYPASTNTADKFFKMMKESAILTWLGYQ